MGTSQFINCSLTGRFISLLFFPRAKHRWQLEQAITDYIFYYNNKRIKAKLKGLSPVQYRTKSFH
jgi:transposase InsO family protein